MTIKELEKEIREKTTVLDKDELKKVTVPFDCQIYPEKEVKIKNRFSGQECTMPGYAAAVYDTIIGAEQFGQWDTVRAGLDWFKQHFAAQYMVVLD